MGLLDDAIREHLDLKRRRGADPAEVERAEREALGPVRRNRDPGDAADPEDQAPAAGFAYDHEDDQDWHEPAASGPEFADLHGEFDEFEDDEPDFAPPSGSAEGGPARPRSLGGPHDYETSAPDDYAPPDPGGYAAPAPGDYAGSDPGGYEPPDPDDYESPRVRDEAAPPLDDPAAPPRSWSAADDDAFDEEPFPTTSGSARRPADPAGDETREYRIDGDRDPAEDEVDEDMLEETPEFLQDTPDHDRLWFEQRPPRDFDFDG